MHEIQYGDYAEAVDKSKVQAHWDKEAEYYSDSHSGLPASIRWINHICDSHDDALEYIRSHDNGWYDQLAVKYKNPTKPVSSKALTALKERRTKEYNKIAPYASAHSIKMLKSDFIGCSCCGSKLRREKLTGEVCPLCRTDLRSKTTLETLQKYKDNVAALDAKIKDEIKAIAAKSPAETRWLVKVEYHT